MSDSFRSSVLPLMIKDRKGVVVNRTLTKLSNRELRFLKSKKPIKVKSTLREETKIEFNPYLVRRKKETKEKGVSKRKDRQTQERCDRAVQEEAKTLIRCSRCWHVPLHGMTKTDAADDGGGDEDDV